ncbi:hypothetical protein D3C80_1883230 [compost metagenome]
MTEAWEEISTSAEDVPVLLAWEAADRLVALFETQDEDFRRQIALKGVSEFAYRLVANEMVGSEPMARQLEAMAGYVRRNMK